MKKVHADGRDNYYLPLTTIKKIDKWLAEKYHVNCLENFEELEAEMKEIVIGNKVERLELQ